ncbi:hypothetical protein BLNAU_13805 [Blattamonas nauphoetae]|uniref:Uncharacterized protein n=1 Tax=Blattamonas nauphoetae TaxID=2049346 RepID=A0ABQ9XK32_9EUKA|nr:hypothetical protein BLNAU_13805 [Blattamonas nauphoetae]
MLLDLKQYDLDERMVMYSSDLASPNSTSPPIKRCCRDGKSMRCWPCGRGLRIDGVPETVKTRVTRHVITSLLKLHPNEREIVLAHHNAALKKLLEATLSLTDQPRNFLRIGRSSELFQLKYCFRRKETHSIFFFVV